MTIAIYCGVTQQQNNFYASLCVVLRKSYFIYLPFGFIDELWGNRTNQPTNLMFSTIAETEGKVWPMKSIKAPSSVITGRSHAVVVLESYVACCVFCGTPRAFHMIILKVKISNLNIKISFHNFLRNNNSCRSLYVLREIT